MQYLRMSYSSGNTLESCARKFELDKLYPKRLRKDDAFAADVGKALHAGYQDYLIHGDRDQATWVFLQEYPYHLEFLEKYDYRSCEASLCTLDAMFDSVQMEDYELAMIRRPNTKEETAEGLTGGVIVPAIEVPFEIRFKGLTLPPTPKYPDGCGVSFIGYADAVMKNLMTDLYRSVDIKTHRDTVEDRTGKYKYDSQQTPYGIVVQHIAGHNVEQFEVNYLDCKIDILEPRVKLYPFLRTIEDVQEWLTTRVIQIQTMQRYVELGFFPRTSGGCMFYNKPCRYLEPCVSRDAETLNAWFLQGEKAQEEEDDWQPWVLVEIDPFGGDQ